MTDPGDARSRVLEILAEHPAGLSGVEVAARVQGEGLAASQSSVYDWLNADAVKARHGVWVHPDLCQLTDPEAPPASAITQAAAPAARQLTRQVTTKLTPAPTARSSTSWQRVILAAGLCVGLAGAALTATGLYAVAVGSGVPAGLAWLYVAATDGLALVAYGATSIVQRTADRLYAWLIVLVAAGLSGLAQATHLGQGAGTDATVTEGWLRFGVGYWPAVSTAICAHLLWLVSRSGRLTGRMHQPVIPARPEGAEAAVYRLYDRYGDLLYVGCTIRPAVRLRAHQRRQPWWPEVAGSEVIWYSTVDQAARAEAEAVRSERPIHNVGLAAYGWSPEPTPTPTEPEDRATEPPTEPASPAHLELVARPTEPPASRAEPAEVSHPEPASRSEPRAASRPTSGGGGSLRACDCGLEYCPGLVPRSTRSAHLRRVRQSG